MVMEAAAEDESPADYRPLVRIVCTGTRTVKTTGDRVPCTHVFFFGFLRDATIQVPCPKCDTMNTIDRRPT